jgi:hypothetical protein
MFNPTSKSTAESLERSMGLFPALTAISYIPTEECSSIPREVSVTLDPNVGALTPFLDPECREEPPFIMSIPFACDVDP